jgi:DNA end-binding protein Ku
MVARTIWKGVIRFGEFRLPVRLHSAVVDRTVHFHLLHDADHVRVRQRLVDPQSGQTWDYQDTKRGYEVERGRFVMLHDEELAEIEPKPSRDIAVACFLPRHVISHAWYDRPYYLGPDGHEEVYAALAMALEQQQCEGLARWTFRRKEYVGALTSGGGALMLITLRYEGEVLSASALERPEGREILRKERDMARQLIGTLDDDFRPEEFRDDYRHRVLEMIEAKRQGETWEPEEQEPQRGEEQSLEKALAASLKSDRRRVRKHGKAS